MLSSRSVFFFVAFALAACADEPERILTREAAERAPEKVLLAKIGEARITLADVLSAIAARGALAQERYQAPQAKFAFLESLVDFEVMAREAEASGLHRSPEIARALKAALAQALWDRGALPGADRTALRESDLRAYYAAHPDVFHEPDAADAAHILFALPEGKAPMEARQEARTKATEALARLGANVSPEAFAEEARRSSEDAATKRLGGALTLLAGRAEEGETPEELVRAAFEQPVGEVRLVESPLGVHLLRVAARRPGKPAAFDAVRKKVEAKVYAAERRAGLRKLLGSRLRAAPPSYDDAVLARVDAEAREAQRKRIESNDGGAAPMSPVARDGGLP